MNMAQSESDPRDPPRDMSNQNREEPSAPHEGAHGNPGPSEDSDKRHPPDSNRSSESGHGAEGGAGESSQATGNPRNAG